MSVNQPVLPSSYTLRRGCYEAVRCMFDFFKMSEPLVFCSIEWHTTLFSLLFFLTKEDGSCRNARDMLHNAMVIAAPVDRSCASDSPHLSPCSSVLVCVCGGVVSCGMACISKTGSEEIGGVPGTDSATEFHTTTQITLFFFSG